MARSFPPQAFLHKFTNTIRVLTLRLNDGEMFTTACYSIRRVNHFDGTLFFWPIRMNMLPDTVTLMLMSDIGRTITSPLPVFAMAIPVLSGVDLTPRARAFIGR